MTPNRLIAAAAVIGIIVVAAPSVARAEASAALSTTDATTSGGGASRSETNKAAPAATLHARATPPRKKTRRKAEIRFQANAGAGGSTWRTDAMGYTSVQLALRGWNLVSVYTLIRFGYASVDQRLLTFLSLGAQIWARIGKLRPYFRIGGVHTHEEPWPSVVRQPAGVLVGIGEGIRHRAGVDMGAGIDYPVKHWPQRKLTLYLSGEFSTTWLTYSSGPSWYFSGNLGIGINYSL